MKIVHCIRKKKKNLSCAQKIEMTKLILTSKHFIYLYNISENIQPLEIHNRIPYI